MEKYAEFTQGSQPLSAHHVGNLLPASISFHLLLMGTVNMEDVTANVFLERTELCVVPLFIALVLYHGQTTKANDSL